MLGIILCLVTLIGALGGSLRFQENFYEEVFDLVDSDEGFEEELAKGKQENPDAATNTTTDIPGMDESSITQAAVEDEQPAQKTPPVKAPTVEEEAAEVEPAGVEPAEVEAYDQEEVFASI